MHPPTYHLGADFDEKLTSFVNALLAASDDVFGREFAQVNEFVQQACTDRSKRDDQELRRTPKALYLLEAISYKVYDQVNREAFNRTKDTLIILPDCLSLHNPECKKRDGKHGDDCRYCTPECQAFEVSKLARTYGAKVLFSKRKLKDQLTYHAKKADTIGVIGVGCLLMLADGMRTAMDLSIPVRGVPLDYTGCEHWNDQPFASAFPMSQLQQILEEKYGSAGSPADSR